MAKRKKTKATKGISPSHQWNLDNPDRIEAARSKYARKMARRRRAMTPFQRVQDDLGRLIMRLNTKADRRRLLKGALRDLAQS